MKLRSLEPLWPTAKLKRRAWDLEMELWSLELLAYLARGRVLRATSSLSSILHGQTDEGKRRAWNLEMKLRSLEPLWPSAKLKRRAWDLEMELWSLGFRTWPTVEVKRGRLCGPT